jgi:hypothetical protein
MTTRQLLDHLLVLSVLLCGQAAFGQTGNPGASAGYRATSSGAGQPTAWTALARLARRADGRQNLLATPLPAFTTAQPAASASSLSLAGLFTQIASAGGWDTTLTLVNLGTSQGEALLNFYSNDGSASPLTFTFPQLPAAGSSLESTLDETLAPNASLLIDTTGPLAQASITGSAQLLTGGLVDGFAIFKYTPTNQQAVVPLETRNASSYLLSFDDTGTVGTGLAIANLATTRASVNVVVRDDTGAKISTAIASIPLDAGGHNSFMLTDAAQGFPEVAGKRGTVEFDAPAGGRIGVLGLRTNSGALTTLPLLASVAAGGGTFAHLASGGGWMTTLTLVNAGTSSATIKLNFFDDQGAALTLPVAFPQTGTNLTTATVGWTLAAGATMTVVTQSPDSGPALTGSAQLVTAGLVSGFAVFRYNPSGQEAVVPLETRTPSSFVLAFDNTGGVSTGLAVANTTAQAASVPVTVRDDSGNVLTTQSISLPAMGHTSFMLTDANLGYPQTAGKRGVIEFDVPSAGQIAALGIRAQGRVITSVPALAKISTDVKAVSQRALVQTGLAIGQASNVLQSQVDVLFNTDGSNLKCQQLSGSGSMQTGTTATYVYQGQSIYPLTIYYDSNCTQPYIVADVTGGGNTTGNSSVLTETATYFGSNGTKIGAMALNMALTIGDSGAQVNGLGTFTPATGSQLPVNLGLSCSISSDPTLQCVGAIEQDFPALGIAIGTVTPLTLFQTAGGGINFTGTGSSFTGPLGSLTLTNPTPSTFVVQGGTAYSSISVSGGAASFTLFPPTPTGWTLTDTAHDMKFQVSVIDDQSRTLRLTVIQVSTGEALATGSLDQSGTGTITYSDGSRATIANWTLSD